MAAVKHIYVIPDQEKYKGGDLYDRYDNLKYFADVADLADKAGSGGTDSEFDVAAHGRKPYLNSKVEISVKGYTRNVVTGISQSKGALPGYNITLSDGTEKRDFTYTGTISSFYSWLKTTAKMEIQMFGPKGTPKDPIPAAGEG